MSTYYNNLKTLKNLILMKTMFNLNFKRTQKKKSLHCLYIYIYIYRERERERERERGGVVWSFEFVNFKLNFLYIFLNCFDVMMSKIIYKKIIF